MAAAPKEIHKMAAQGSSQVHRGHIGAQWRWRLFVGCCHRVVWSLVMSATSSLTSTLKNMQWNIINWHVWNKVSILIDISKPKILVQPIVSLIILRIIIHAAKWILIKFSKKKNALLEGVNCNLKLTMYDTPLSIFMSNENALALTHLPRPVMWSSFAPKSFCHDGPTHTD